MKMAALTIAMVVSLASGYAFAQDSDDAQSAIKADCQKRKAPKLAALKAPVLKNGLYANKGACMGCETGWWHTNAEVTLFASPDKAAKTLATLPPETWVYVRDTIMLTRPTRGTVVKAGQGLKLCDTVYHVHSEPDEGEVEQKLWSQGKIVYFNPDHSDADILWDQDLAFTDVNDLGWWAHIRTQTGKVGWTYVYYREHDYSCVWALDREEICASAPKQKPKT